MPYEQTYAKIFILQICHMVIFFTAMEVNCRPSAVQYLDTFDLSDDLSNYTYGHIFKIIGIMYKARRYLNKSSLKNLYYTYIYPYFIYCIEVWGSAANCHLNSLFFLQKKIIRIMTFSPYLAHTGPIFIDLAILPFDKIYIDRISIMMFKVEYELLPKSVTQMFSKNKDIHSHDTRNKIY